MDENELSIGEISSIFRYDKLKKLFLICEQKKDINLLIDFLNHYNILKHNIDETIRLITFFIENNIINEKLLTAISSINLSIITHLPHHLLLLKDILCDHYDLINLVSDFESLNNELN